MKTTTENEESHYSKSFVDMWSDFIDWEKRRKGENGILKKIFEQNNVSSVFEACLGDGCDTIYLIKEGFDVTSNDLDLNFIKKAQENARRENVKLNITSYDWRELDKHLSESSFDSVLCLGNSLTHLFKKSDQLKTLQQFRRVLKKKGILIIDERNYQYFLDKKKEILGGNFRYGRKCVYCGEKVHGYPIAITKNRVVMEYHDTIRNTKGRLVLYPIKKGEMLELLKEAGFMKIEQYSDYKRGYNPNADFYTYVCKK